MNDSANDKVAELEAKNTRLKATIAMLEARVAELESITAKLKKALYGKKSEREIGTDPNQLILESILKDVDALNGQIDQAQKEQEKISRRATMAKKPRRTREELIPDDLRRVEIVHDIPEEDKIDLVSGKPLVKIGEDRVEKLAIKPQECFIKVHVYPKYAAIGNPAQGVVRAPAPSFAIPGGSYDESFLAMIACDKVAMHLPLYRIAERLGALGVDVKRQTLSKLFIAVGELLGVLMEPLKQEILATQIIFTDDTPVDMLEKGKGKTVKGRVWVYIAGGPGLRLRIYEFTRDRKKCRPQEFLGDYRGHIHADAYKGYDELFKRLGVIECACWMHIRRKFQDAEDGPSELRTKFLDDIRMLYRWERIARLKSPDTILAVRQKHIAPLVDTIIKRAQDAVLNQAFLPASAFGKAINYLLNLGDAVKTFLSNPYLSPDNGESERALRAMAIGRKNWLFVGSEKGGEATAVLFTLIQNCRMLDIDPFEYIEDVLTRIQDYPANRVADLLPHHWLAAKQARVKSPAVI